MRCSERMENLMVKINLGNFQNYHDGNVSKPAIHAIDWHRDRGIDIEGIIKKYDDKFSFCKNVIFRLDVGGVDFLIRSRVYNYDNLYDEVINQKYYCVPLYLIDEISIYTLVNQNIIVLIDDKIMLTNNPLSTTY